MFFAFVYTMQAATYTVANSANSGDNLRDAVAMANSRNEDDTVVFAANSGCANNTCEIVLSDEIVINPVVGGRLRIDNTKACFRPTPSERCRFIQTKTISNSFSIHLATL
ncbi:MAG: hypothetical protein M3209_19230 [Acidobacteriota bacterium]|nr:hypothetical protein [Acidobacteriota bacterium]